MDGDNIPGHGIDGDDDRMASVVDFQRFKDRHGKPKKPKPMSVTALDAITCSDCGNVITDLSKTPYTTEIEGQDTRDSGRYVCPKCHEFLPATVFDPLVSGGEYSVHLDLPYGALRQLLYETDGGPIHAGWAMLNACREHFRANAPDLYRTIFNEEP